MRSPALPSSQTPDPAVAEKGSPPSSLSTTVQGTPQATPSLLPTAALPTPDNGLISEKDPHASARAAVDAALFPSDSYTPTGTYWASLPLRQRAAFNSNIDKIETRREFNATKTLFRAGWWKPLTWYFRNAVLPGAGLGLEGYVLFSIGNLKPLFEIAWPTCWGTAPPGTTSVCNKNLLDSVTYLEVIGIILGQIIVGIEGDWVGRQFGLAQDAVVMLLGVILLTAGWAGGDDLQGWVIFYAISLFVYGFGVGGEYPMTATTTMEATSGGREAEREDRLHRGRKVTQSFLMQGWGQFWNLVVLIVIAEIANAARGATYDAAWAQWVFRWSFAPIILGTAGIAVYRINVWRTVRRNPSPPRKPLTAIVSEKPKHVSGYDVESLKLTLRHFGPRLLATAGAWFANDVLFYGNKLFQGDFIAVISPDSRSLINHWCWALLGVVISLVGYYAASLAIDNKFFGRRTLMILGFAMCFLCSLIPAALYNVLRRSDNIWALQLLYYLFNFFNQFGPNCVTFVVAAECFPRPIRASAHGFSAAVGKLGALLPAVVYSYLGNRERYWFGPWWALVGVVLTVVFLPDTTGLDLAEGERRWRYLRAGRGDEYHGVAVHPQHLSLWERWKGVGRLYDAEKDGRSKMAELVEEWREWEDGKVEADADVGGGGGLPSDEERLFSESVVGYLKEVASAGAGAGRKGAVGKGVAGDIDR
jgi:MFS family permease